jgi:hypothetical protein
MVALAVGLLALTLQNGKRGLAAALAVLIGVFLVYYFLPAPILQGSVDRIFQLSDSSTLRRWFYLESALQSFRAYWPIGAGWGNAFWYFEGAGLVPTGFIPWYHNDFLNLGVQVGLPGLLLYLGFWFSMLRAFRKWLRQAGKSAEALPFVLGGFAATCTALAGALFDHLLWRPDMGGLVALVAGIAVAGLKLAVPVAEPVS